MLRFPDAQAAQPTPAGQHCAPAAAAPLQPSSYPSTPPAMPHTDLPRSAAPASQQPIAHKFVFFIRTILIDFC